MAKQDRNIPNGSTAYDSKFEKTSHLAGDSLLLGTYPPSYYLDASNLSNFHSVLITDPTIISLINSVGTGVTSWNSRTGVVIPTINDYTWAQINKTISNIVDITTRSHSSLQNLTNDDHTQYSLVTGTRAYTGIVSYSIHPAFLTDTQIIDKKYVDDSIITLSSSLPLTYLLLDQTVPQTIIGGAPIFSAGLFITGGSGLDIENGQTIQVFDATNTKWLNIYHDGTDAYIFASGGGIRIPNDIVTIGDGGYLVIQSAGDDKNITIKHNDTNGLITSSDGTISFDNEHLITTGNITAFTAKLTALTDGYVPYHVSDATGLANSVIQADTSTVGIGVAPNSAIRLFLESLTISATGFGDGLYVRDPIRVVNVNETNWFTTAQIDNNAYTINTGITDGGYRHGLVIAGAAYQPDFKGTLSDQRGIRILHGIISSNASAIITNSYGLYIDSYKTTGTVTNMYAIYQASNLASNYFAGVITSPNFISNIAPGTQPYACTSTTLNTNLNADLLDGQHGAYYAAASTVYWSEVGGILSPVTTTNSVNIATGEAYMQNSANLLRIPPLSLTSICLGNSGNATMTGVENFLMGNSAGASLTDGTYNTAIGVSTLTTLTVGDYNVAIGSLALQLCLDGNNNVAIGNGAFQRVSSGSTNVGIGVGVFYYITTQSSNTGIGHNAGFYNANGTFNTFVGVLAGYGASTKSNSYNTCIGGWAGKALDTGSYNVMVGLSAGVANTTGANNTFIGYKAGFSNTTTSSSVFLGYYAGYYETTASTFFIDNQDRTSAALSRTNSLMYGSFNATVASQWLTINGNLGISTASPTARLHLPAGTATASTAPLKFTSGTLLATPAAGVVEFYDGRWYITGTAKQRVIDRTGGVIVATTTVANTTTETTLWTETLSANAMKVGRIYKLFCCGIADNKSASDDITFNLYFGGTLVGTYNPAMGSISAGTHWDAQINITIRTIGVGGTCAVCTMIQIGTFSDKTSSLQAIDTTAANSVTLKVQWDNANPANTISIYQGWLELKN
ncbi:hypothetical protein CCP3SC1AL1_310012 [Gammaproteobacteria bacterium]